MTTKDYCSVSKLDVHSELVDINVKLEQLDTEIGGFLWRWGRKNWTDIEIPEEFKEYESEMNEIRELLKEAIDKSLDARIRAFKILCADLKDVRN